jgi:outer membrane protein assembly factor BamD (BamD/ComL family)
MNGDRLKRAVWIVMAAVVLTASACSRDKDPYADWKAPQLLDEGEKALRARDLSGAYYFFKRGLAKAEKAGARPEQTRIFTSRMLYIAAAQENLAEAEKIFARLGGATDPQKMDVRVALHLAILMQRAGRTADARALADKIAQRLGSSPPQFEELAFFAVGWIVVDRARSANVELTRAKEASDGFMAALTSIAEAVIGPHQPLLPGLRAWIAGYIDHLYDTDRTLVAKEIADLVERIDQTAVTADDKNACLLLDPAFPNLGCLAEWPTN